MSTRIIAVALAITIARLALVNPAGAGPQIDPAAALPAGALRTDTSLYLREAAAGPIRWQPWGAASLSLARSLKRPVLLDIGAMWCHWCHVMDQTTYADPQVAELINHKFVPIKIDSDQRPDIDGYYQQAAQRFGAGGWPLTCFTLPDGAPLLIVGYLPPRASDQNPQSPGMTYVLNRVADAYVSDPGLSRSADEIAARIASAEPFNGGGKDQPAQVEAEIVRAIGASYNPKTGGFGEGQGPRFYDFPALRLGLAHGFFGHPEFTSIALDSLRKIAAGGVYDQLAGGFHRYSTDSAWRVPHFEKMGADQAMAITAYAEAYQFSGDEEFARVARETLGYVNATLLDPKTHTFYSHQDADAFPGDDGSYYTWTKGELVHGLDSKSARVAQLYFGFDQDPAIAPDGRVVLRRAMTINQVAARLGLSRRQARAALTRAIARMVSIRERRRKPQVDTAILVDRNALMATAYLTAADAFNDRALRRVALDDLDYLIAHAGAGDGSFCHIWSNSKAQLQGLAADQVYMLAALVAAYQASWEPRYLIQARALGRTIMQKFRDPASGLLQNHARSDQGTVLAAAKATADALYDDPMPSIQASAAIALDTLGALASDHDLHDDATELLGAASNRVSPDAGSSAATLGAALERRTDGATRIIVVGKEDSPAKRALLQAAAKEYRPGKVVIATDSLAAPSDLPSEAKRQMLAAAHRREPFAFVCFKSRCTTPVGDPDTLAKTIGEFGVHAAHRVARSAAPR